MEPSGSEPMTLTAPLEASLRYLPVPEMVPPGLKYSTLTAMVDLTPATCGMWLSLTSGVLPMSSARLLWMVM